MRVTVALILLVVVLGSADAFWFFGGQDTKVETVKKERHEVEKRDAKLNVAEEDAEEDAEDDEDDEEDENDEHIIEKREAGDDFENEDEEDEDDE